MKRLEAVIFDWAGTTVDCGSLAPVRAVTNLFALRGIQLSDAEVRRDMGLFKKDHIRRILEIEHVEAEWKKRKGRAAKNNDADLEELFADFTVLQMKILEQHSQLIDGVASLAEKLRGRGLKLWDLSVTKDVHFTERFTAQFRFEVFNLLNKTQYTNVVNGNPAGRSNPLLGSSRATPDVQISNPEVGSGAARSIQLGLKLAF